MEYALIYSRGREGLRAPLVQVETHLANGLPGFHIVGMPETAVRESRDRVRSALLNSHFQFPDRRITVNLAPADLPKGGGRFDLPIALGILAASGQLPQTGLRALEFIGELALDGSLRDVRGALPVAMACAEAGRRLVAPAGCAADAALAPDSHVIAARDLLSLCAGLRGRQPLTEVAPRTLAAPDTLADLNEVVGQASGRRALEIAAAGAHHLLLRGPPGTGKTLLASRLPGILPVPDARELLLTLAVRSLSREPISGSARPFRAPHHSATPAALVGGGTIPEPGEISLAHEGVLFLDELPEFPRATLDLLREPLESGVVTLSRARHKVRFPARFQLVAAMNPCPCGYNGDPQHPCRCSPDQVERYRQRLSGPLLDRIDLQVEMPRLSAVDLLRRRGSAESSASVRERVQAARERQLARQGCANGHLDAGHWRAHCRLQSAALARVEAAVDRLGLSARAAHRVIRVARSIADLAGTDTVERAHIDEALGYRLVS